MFGLIYGLTSNDNIIYRKSFNDKINANNIELEQCFRTEKRQDTIDDVLESSRLPRKDKTMFFHVTNCLTDGVIDLTPRQSCAIESAALTNPNFDIFVLFASPVAAIDPKNISQRISALLQYPNVFLRHNDLWKYTKDTPAQQWFESGVLFQSQFLTAHLSDFLRLMTLWRFGGIYMDLDVIVKESFDNVPLNFAGAESEDVVANGVMSYDSNGFGHYIVDMMLRRFVTQFRGDLWAHNGPSLITDILMHEICKTNDTKYMTLEQCHGFQVFPTNVFYAIHYTNWQHFFEAKHLNTSLALTAQSHLIHVWNKLSSTTPIKHSIQTAYKFYAEKLCPNVYATITQDF